MDLIQIMQEGERKFIDRYKTLRNLGSICELQSVCRTQSNDKQLKISALISRQENISSAAQIIINKQFKSIKIKYLLFDNLLLKIKSQHEKTIYLRLILKAMQNRTMLHIKFNPITGFIHLYSFNCILSQSADLENINNIYQLINQKQAFQCIINQLHFIKFFNLCHQSSLNKSYNNLIQLKSYINCSNYYTWFALKNSTKNVKRSENFIVYDESKKQFISMEKTQAENVFIQALSNIYYKKPQNKSISLLNQEQDRNLSKKYLQKALMTAKNQNQITQINVAQEILDSIQNEGDTKLNSHQVKGTIYVRIQKSKPKVTRYYQNLILQSLPNREFLNLVKFFKIKDNKAFNQKWEITNLYQSLPLDQYMKKNIVTVSIFTKTSIFNQISNVLKYFRDLNSVYHHLIPKNLYVKRGLMVKCTDLSNVYKYNVNNLFYSNKAQLEIPYNKFPYVFNLRNNKQSSIDDQRSDIYSFGIILYETLLNKPYLNIKYSKVKKLNDFQKIMLLQKSVISIKQSMRQYHDELLNLFIQFSMKCSVTDIVSKETDINQLQDEQNQYDYDYQIHGQYQFKLQERPYLDWVVIITKDFFSCYQKYLV